MYVFDTSSFSALFKFYPKIFTSLWDKVNSAVADGHIISVSESYTELQKRDRDETVNEWLKVNKDIFLPPNAKEALFIMNDLFMVKNGHFQTLVEEKKRLNGGVCADPFIVAKAKINQYCVVTEEFYKPNAAKIPNACEFFSTKFCNLEQFMTQKNWVF